MNGLVRKDLITLKKQMLSTVTALLFPVILFFIFWQGTGALLIGALVFPFLTIFTPFNFRASDDQAKWDKYAITLPLLKKQIVASRYVSCCFICVVYFVLSLVLNIGAYIGFQDHSLSTHLLSACIGLGASLFFVFLLLPTSYAKGIGASVWVLAVVLIIYFVAIAMIRKMNVDLSSLSPSPTHLVLLAGISVAVIIGFSLLSYIVSVAMYRKKHS